MERVVAHSSGRLVSEAMTTAVVPIGPDEPVEEALRLAEERATHHLLVLDEGTLVGILSRRDLEQAEPGSRVSDCMSVPVITVRPDALLASAAVTMADFEVSCLPVVIGGLILGLLSEEGDPGRGGLAGRREASRPRALAGPKPLRPH